MWGETSAHDLRHFFSSPPAGILLNSTFKFKFKFAGCCLEKEILSTASCKLETTIVCRNLHPEAPPGSACVASAGGLSSPSCSRAPRGRTALLADTSDFYDRRGLRQRPIFASALLILHRRRDGGHLEPTAHGCRWQPMRRRSRRHALASVTRLKPIRSRRVSLCGCEYSSQSHRLFACTFGPGDSEKYSVVVV